MVAEKLESRIEDLTRYYDFRVYLKPQSPSEVAISIYDDFHRKVPSRWSSLLREVGPYIANGKEMRRKIDIQDENERNLASINSDSTVIFLVHGLQQNPKAMTKLGQTLRAENFTPLFIGYDANPRKHFAEFVSLVSNQINYFLERIPSITRIIGLGHSTGADILRYGINTSVRGIKDLQGLVLASPTTNGLEPNFLDKLIFDKSIHYSSPNEKEAQDFIPEIQKKVAIPAITLFGLNEYFIPVSAAVDTTGMNLALDRFCHIQGTGHDTDYNKIYLEATKLIGREIK